MRRRKLVLWVLAVLAVVLAAVLFWHRSAPPAPVRLLPDGDGILYVNLKLLRRAGVLENLPQAKREPEYEQFVRETGFEFERDLDEVAVAVHAPRAPAGQQRYSEVFAGKFDLPRARAYFRKLALNVENYREVEIFSIPVEDRTVRVAILGVGRVAVSNAEDANLLRGIIDRSKRMAKPFHGPSLVKAHYTDLPFATVAWGVARVARDDAGSTGVRAPWLLRSLVGGTEVLFSARYLGSVELKAQAYAPSQSEAEKMAKSANTLLELFRAVEGSIELEGSDADVKELFRNITVEQDGATVVLEAEVSPDFLRKAFASRPAEIVNPDSGKAAPPK